MDNPADNKHPIHDLIRRRWSPRAFSARPLERETLLSLLEAARWAASSYNEQPWCFLVATKDDQAEYDRLLGCLVEANAAWAKHAPVLMLSVASLRFARNGKANRHAYHDVGLAVENLVLQATSMGLATHQMAGFYAETACEVYGIPETHAPVAVIAVGYPADAPGANQPAPRSRKPLNDFVYAGQWGQVARLLEQQG